MLEVTLSKHYQISIPQEIRDLLNLQVGQKFSVVLKNDSITLVPKRLFEKVGIPRKKREGGIK
jgi:AbrB family looped-hinge helix DNA binding protein